ncbi:uncharacterized protein F5891DRAFT_1258645, partial [Suillus fuscotomentosus]
MESEYRSFFISSYLMQFKGDVVHHNLRLTRRSKTLRTLNQQHHRSFRNSKKSCRHSDHSFAASDWMFAKLHAYFQSLNISFSRPDNHWPVAEAQQGTLVPEQQEFSKKFAIRRYNQAACNQVDIDIMSYRGLLQKSDWMDTERNTSKITEKLTLKRSAEGSTYYSTEIKVILLFGLKELKAMISWEDGGEEIRTPAVVVYDDEQELIALESAASRDFSRLVQDNYRDRIEQGAKWSWYLIVITYSSASFDRWYPELIAWWSMVESPSPRVTGMPNASKRLQENMTKCTGENGAARGGIIAHDVEGRKNLSACMILAAELGLYNFSVYCGVMIRYPRDAIIYRGDCHKPNLKF